MPPGSPTRFSHAPVIVIWEATRACDLVCRHCRAEAHPSADPFELTDREARQMIDRVRAAFGPVLFVLTGGDPLKRAGLTALIRHASSVGLKVGITPSATPLLTCDAINRLHDAGLQRLAISLDGADATTHDAFRGVPGTFARSISVLEHAQKIGLEIQINSSICTQNRGQLHALADLAGYMGVSLWSVFVIVPTGRANTDLVPTAVEHELTYRALAGIALDAKTHFQIKTTAGQPYYRVLDQERQRRGLPAMPRRGSGVNDGNGFLFISHTGDICPSGFLPLVCGNIRSDDLASVYREHPTFRRLRDPDTFTGKCAVCPHNRRCGGSRSRTYALTGDAFGSDPTCVFNPPLPAYGSGGDSRSSITSSAV